MWGCVCAVNAMSPEGCTIPEIHFNNGLQLKDVCIDIVMLYNVIKDQYK